MRVALFGSPAFAIPSLDVLAKHHELVLVVTQPDKPVGRGMKLQSPATATEAKKRGIALKQPAKLRKNQAFQDYLASLELDLCVTAAYGKILPQALLDVPTHGFLNVHGSLLPKYRGAAPIQWALINGEAETGISIMQTEAGLDTGPVRHVVKYLIQEDDTAITLFTKLAHLGADALKEALELLEDNVLPLVPQNHDEATHSPMLAKTDGLVRWDDSAKAVYNRYQGVKAWPGSWTNHNDKVLKIHDMSLASSSGKSGSILSIDSDGVTVAAAENSVILKTVQAPNKPKMSAYDWANGYQIKVGDRLG